MIIGICGKSGSGKTTLANQIIENLPTKAVHLDIDKVGHKVLSFPEVKEELKNSFGESIINLNEVDRKKLGEIVFASRNEMDKLTEITWKYMQMEIDDYLEENKDKVVILDWLLLPHTKYFDMCDMKILLAEDEHDLKRALTISGVSRKERKQRAIKRDNITEDAFLLIESASIDVSGFSFDHILQKTDKNEVKRIVKLL